MRTCGDRMQYRFGDVHCGMWIRCMRCQSQSHHANNRGQYDVVSIYMNVEKNDKETSVPMYKAERNTDIWRGSSGVP